MKATHLACTLAALATGAALSSPPAWAQTPTPTPPSPPAAPPAPAATAAPAPAPAPAPTAQPLAPAVDASPSAPRPATTNATRRVARDREDAAADATAAPPPSPSAPPPAVDVPPPPAVPAPDTPLIDAWLGVHGLVVPSAGYDAFSEDDALTSFTAGAGLTLVRIASTHIAAVVSLSTGGAESSYRGSPTDLSLLRLSLGPELRFPLLSRLYAYGRLSPQLVHSTASLGDAGAGSKLEEDEWLFGVDSAVGVSARIGEVYANRSSSPVCFFVRGEVGYTWTPSSELELTPADANAPIRSEPVNLGDLALSGVSFRGALGIGY